MRRRRSGAAAAPRAPAPLPLHQPWHRRLRRVRPSPAAKRHSQTRRLPPNPKLPPLARHGARPPLVSAARRPSIAPHLPSRHALEPPPPKVGSPPPPYGAAARLRASLMCKAQRGGVGCAAPVNTVQASYEVRPCRPRKRLGRFFVRLPSGGRLPVVPPAELVCRGFLPPRGIPFAQPPATGAAPPACEQPPPVSGAWLMVRRNCAVTQLNV